MGTFVGMLARVCVAVGVTAAGVLTVVLPGGPATAAPVPCVQTHSAPYTGGPIGVAGAINLEIFPSASLPETAVVADVDVRVVLEDANEETYFELYQGGPRAELARFGDFSFPQNVDLTFDDEIGQTRAMGQATGRVAPREPLTVFDGGPIAHSSGRMWQLIVHNFSESSEVMPRSLTLTFTLASCDSDGDGVEEKVDNCPTVANADQTNWDGDAQGNACDATPGTAPVTPTSTPTIPPPPGCVTDCAYDRTVGMKLKAERHRFAGKVVSPAVGCVADVRVTVWKKLPGRDRKLVVVTSRSTGKFATRAPRRPGRYYARVGSPEEPLCAGDKSRIVRVRRH